MGFACYDPSADVGSRAKGALNVTDDGAKMFASHKYLYCTQTKFESRSAILLLTLTAQPVLNLIKKCIGGCFFFFLVYLKLVFPQPRRDENSNASTLESQLQALYRKTAYEQENKTRPITSRAELPIPFFYSNQ
jgi:hypothetical protein